MKKTILQAVSGGYDSTCLLIKNLQNGDSVYPLYVHSSCVHPIKRAIESTVVKNLVKKLQIKFDNLHGLIEKEMKIDHVENIVSFQPVMWCLALFNEAKNRRWNHYDEAHIAYILQDSAISYLPEIKAFWKSLFSFSYPHSDSEILIPKLSFPLQKYHKATILNELNSFDSEITENCWSCEDPGIFKTRRRKDSIEAYIKPCGSCHPCANLKGISSSLIDELKNYKAVINTKSFYDSTENTVKKIIKNASFQCIPLKFISVAETKEKEKRKEDKHTVFKNYI